MPDHAGRPQRPADVKVKGHYEATIFVPLTLPASNTRIPTFHSCLVSRIYPLTFQLSVVPANVSSTSHSAALTLRLPFQITCSDRDHDDIRFGLNTVEQYVDEHLRPRTFSMAEALSTSEQPTG